jgi:hypothetical protein
MHESYGMRLNLCVCREELHAEHRHSGDASGRKECIAVPWVVRDGKLFELPETGAWERD